MITSWQDFWTSVKDPLWPECKEEADFLTLPAWIQNECKNTHGYVPGSYRSAPALPQKTFPINTSTACQLKWSWSTIFLTNETTASCHRTNHHKFDVDSFDFHNTPSKIQDRKDMLGGDWPQRGCDYCKNIEQAGGVSDRILNLDFPGVHAPIELDNDLTATTVTPRMLEVYFDNTCNLKCLYCGPHFSSLWDAENKKHSRFEKNGIIITGDYRKSSNIKSNKSRLFDWLKVNGHSLTNFNILGGEPLYQVEFDECLEFFSAFPAPNLDLQIFTNLNSKLEKVQHVVNTTKQLIDQGKIRKFSVTASLDCWGDAQEYVRFPLDLKQWERNFEYLTEQDWIGLVVGSTVTPLTVKTLDVLIDKLNHWRTRRPIHHYFNSVNQPSYMFIDIFGDLFEQDFQRALSKLPVATQEQQSTYNYLNGISQQSYSNGVNHTEVLKLKTFLTEMDRRRSTNWREIFPWLVLEFEKNQVDH